MIKIYWESISWSKDIGETENLSEKLPEKREELHRLMTAFLEEVNAETELTKKKKSKKKRKKKK